MADELDTSPITTEVIRTGLGAAALEMHHTLVRTAFNPLLYEVRDFGVGIVAADGVLWAEAPGIMGFLGPLPETIKTALVARPTDEFRPGDAYIVNDPYQTGTHISDTTVYMPVFHGGTLVAFSIVTAHWADIGGKTPGGWCPDSTDVYQEGLCFTHQRLIREREPVEELWSFIDANVRFPDVVRGDLAAQIAACRQGGDRVEALCAKFGTATVIEGMSRTIDRTRLAMRRLIRQMPDGIYSASALLDHDGVDRDDPFKVALQLRVEGEGLTVGFQETSAVRRGPVNLPRVGTMSQVRAALKAMLMPDDATNQGHLDVVGFDIPKGLVVSPQRPAPCDSYGYVGLTVLELSVRALSQVLPDRRVATSYQLFGGYLHRVDPHDGTPFIMIDPVHGGNGARATADGPTLIVLGDGDTPNTPVEVTESRYPLRCTQYSLRPGSEGAGEFRGGFGVVREFQLLEPGISLQINTESASHPFALGLDGGQPGAPSHVEVAIDGTVERYDQRTSDIGPLPVGTLIRFCSGGGGGVGDPLTKLPERVLAETHSGLLSRERAEAAYGVVIDDHGQVDGERTLRVRRQRAHGHRPRIDRVGSNHGIHQPQSAAPPPRHEQE